MNSMKTLAKIGVGFIFAFILLVGEALIAKCIDSHSQELIIVLTYGWIVGILFANTCGYLFEDHD